MSPTLGPEGVPELPGAKAHKFVRQGKIVAWEHYPANHADIMARNGINPKSANDAGYISQNRNGIAVGGVSGSYDLGDDEAERQETIEIVKDITGREVRSY